MSWIEKGCGASWRKPLAQFMDESEFMNQADHLPSNAFCVTFLTVPVAI